MHTPVTKTREDWRYCMSLPANLDKVNANEPKDNRFSSEKTQRGTLMQVDSGHLTSGSHQSLNRHHLASESESDSMKSGDYDADDEFDECLHDYDEHEEGNPCSLFELDKRFRLENALVLLRARPKISERVLSSDSDEEFHESEYDVIESHDEKDVDETLKRRTSLHKKKIARSFSDVKLRPKVSRSASSSSIKDKSHNGNKFRSMPNIRSHSPLKSSRSLSFDHRSLTSHKEEQDEIDQGSRGSTGSSIGKCKSDDADESFVPNSELDTWSNWNIPSKMKNFWVDSSDLDLSFDNSNEYQAPRGVSRALLERLTFGRNPRSPNEKSTLVGGRFRVSVIREEENSSRRGSASSCELTLKNSPLIVASSFTRPADVSVHPVSNPAQICSPRLAESFARELSFGDDEIHQSSPIDATSYSETSRIYTLATNANFEEDNLAIHNNSYLNEDSYLPSTIIDGYGEDVSCLPVSDDGDSSVLLIENNLTICNETDQNERGVKIDTATYEEGHSVLPTLLSLASSLPSVQVTTSLWKSASDSASELSSISVLASTSGFSSASEFASPLGLRVATMSVPEETSSESVLMPASATALSSASDFASMFAPTQVTTSLLKPISATDPSFLSTSESATEVNEQRSDSIYLLSEYDNAEGSEMFPNEDLPDGGFILDQCNEPLISGVSVTDRRCSRELVLETDDVVLNGLSTINVTSKETVPLSGTGLSKNILLSRETEIPKEMVSVQDTGLSNVNALSKMPVQSDDTSFVMDAVESNLTIEFASTHSRSDDTESMISDCLRERAASPTFAVLKTYDVINDVPCSLEDYEILDGKRDLVIY